MSENKEAKQAPSVDEKFMLTNEQESVLMLVESMLHGAGLTEHAARLQAPAIEAGERDEREDFETAMEKHGRMRPFLRWPGDGSYTDDRLEWARRGWLAALATDPTMSEAARDVLSERRRQITEEGWATKHDDLHTDRGMAAAAAVYALHAADVVGVYCDFWPWEPHWWKPSTPRRNLVKAGALIIAEIERIDRAAAKEGS